MKKKLSYLLATFFGFGCAPFAPGTVGSLATLPLAFALCYFWGIWGILAGVIITFFIGVYTSSEVLKYTPHDPGFIVIDEVAGQLLTFATVAPYLQNTSKGLIIYITGFILFRIFDIAKPQPVKWADRKILNAWGVMLDDIIAGCYAMLILLIL
ncbi:MAG: phosphatidylglycerophosphatase A, partial [Alphaproteobacteria bacterium]|nr:phosphatidylglycerophosphatase A [Alphaproteobacteria bacterium]